VKDKVVMKQRALRPECLLFIGTPDQREQGLLAQLRESVQVRITPDVLSAYSEVALCVPDFVFFSVTQQNTASLRLFRQLKHMNHTCVVVCHDTALQAFMGKGFDQRCWLPKNIPGASVLQNWKCQMLDLQHAEDRRRMFEIAALRPQRKALPAEIGKRRQALFHIAQPA
jgi:hypothetical protein